MPLICLATSQKENSMTLKAYIKYQLRYDIIALIVFGTLIAIPSFVFAQEDAADTDLTRHDKLLERFDRNGDGKLGPEERRHARELRDDRADSDLTRQLRRLEARNALVRADGGDAASALEPDRWRSP